jgi:hypothetical protein
MMLFSHIERQDEDKGRSSIKLIMMLFSHVEGRAEDKVRSSNKHTQNDELRTKGDLQVS